MRPPLVKKEDTFGSPERGGRFAGASANRCVWCKGTLGNPHEPTCVVWTKKARVRAIVEYEVEVPMSWTAEDILFHRNEGSWCANNLIDELEPLIEKGFESGQVSIGKCLCDFVRYEVIDEGPI